MVIKSNNNIKKTLNALEIFILLFECKALKKFISVLKNCSGNHNSLEIKFLTHNQNIFHLITATKSFTSFENTETIVMMQ